MNLYNSLAVEYSTEILDGKNGKTLKSRVPKKNLLLDSGLDGIAIRSFWSSFSHCVLGTGIKPTKRDSGAVTLTISNNVATASAGFFEAGDVGRLIKLDSGQEAYVTSYTSNTVVGFVGATDDAASEFTVWYVNESGHESEEVRSNNLLSESSSWDGSQYTHTREFLFPVETSAKTYREIGWSHTGTAGNNLFGRDLIPSGGESVSSGQQYKVKVKLFIGLSPIVPVAVSDLATGYDATGQAVVLTTEFSLVGAAGSGDIFSGNSGLEPSTTKVISLGYPNALPANTVSGEESRAVLHSKNATKKGYVSGSRKIEFYAIFGVAEGNGSCYSLQFGSSVPNYKHRLDTTLSKQNTHTLRVDFAISWGRSLVN